MSTYPKYKRSGIAWLGDIPESWSIRKIFGLFTENTKKNQSFTYRNAMQFNYGKLVDKNEVFDTNEVRDIYSKYTVIKKNDIAINGLNLNYDLVSQRIALSPKEGIITSAYIVISPREGICPEYYCYLFKGMDSKKMFHGMGTGIRLTLAFKELRNQKLPLPPLPEQEAIVKYLDAETAKIDKAIAAEEKMIALLQERREIIINEAVGGGEGFNAEAQSCGARRGWKVMRLRNCIASSFTGVWGKDTTPGSKQLVCYRVADFDYSRGGLRDDRLTVRAYSEKEIAGKLVQYGDLLIEKSGGGDISPVGRVIFVDSDRPATCSNFIQQIRCKREFNSKFMSFVFRSLYSRKVNGYYYNQTTGIQNLKVREFLSTALPLPPLPEQERIVKYLDAETGKIDRAIEVKRRQIALLRERREIVINEVVTGKVKVA